jgi:O-antigen ligase
LTIPSQDAAGGAERGAGASRWVGWLLLLPLPVAVACFATVHPIPRAVVSLLSLGVSAAVLLQVRREHRGRRAEIGRAQLGLLGLGLGLCFVNLAMLIPAGAGLRAALQPGWAAALQDLWAVAGLSVDGHPLALHPSAGLLAAGQAGVALVFAAAASAVVRSRRRALRLASAVVGVALAVVALGWLQAASGAGSVYWTSGLPEGIVRAPFFGPFIDPNHAGILLAAAVPLCAGLASRGEGAGRWAWRAALPLLLVATWSTTSRGALLGATLALGLWAALLGWRVVTASVVGLFGVGLTAFVLAGPARVTALLTERLMPAAATPDPFGDRLGLWAEALELARGAPWVGVGPGSFGDGHWLVKRGVAYSAAVHAHNEPVQALAEHGFVFGGAWIVLMAAPLGLGLMRVRALELGRRRSLGAALVAAYAAVLFGGLYEFPLRTLSLLLLAALLGGSLLGALSEDEPRVGPRGQQAWMAGLGMAALVGLLAPAAVALSRWAPDHAYSDTAPAFVAAAEAWDEAVLADDPRPYVEASLELGRSAIDRRPLQMRSLLLVARSLRGLGDEAAALDFLREAVRIFPASPHLWVWLARAERGGGDVEAARAAWKRALALDFAPDEDDAGFVLEAIAAEDAPASAVEAIIPPRVDRLREAGRVLSRTRSPADWQAAQRLFEQAVALDPQAAHAYAVALLRWEEPERAFAQISTLPERSCPVARTGAEALYDLQRYGEAVTWFELAVSRCGSDDRAARVGLARSRVEAGVAGARPLLEALVAEEPGAHALRRLLLRVLRAEAVELSLLVPHVQALVDAGVATEQERENLERLKVGLPAR